MAIQGVKEPCCFNSNAPNIWRSESTVGPRNDCYVPSSSFYRDARPPGARPTPAAALTLPRRAAGLSRAGASPVELPAAGLVGAREVLLLTAEAPAPLDPSIGLSWSLFRSTHPRSSVASTSDAGSRRPSCSLSRPGASASVVRAGL